MSSSSRVVIGLPGKIFKSIKGAFKVPAAKTKDSLLKPTSPPKNIVGADGKPLSPARKKFYQDQADATNKSRRQQNRLDVERNARARYKGIRNRVIGAGAVVGIGEGTRRAITGGDETKVSAPVTNKSSTIASSPQMPKKEFINWRDRPGTVDARVRPGSETAKKKFSFSLPSKSKSDPKPLHERSFREGRTFYKKGTAAHTAKTKAYSKRREAAAKEEAKVLTRPMQGAAREGITAQSAGDYLIKASKDYSAKVNTTSDRVVVKDSKSSGNNRLGTGTKANKQDSSSGNKSFNRKQNRLGTGTKANNQNTSFFSQFEGLKDFFGNTSYKGRRGRRNPIIK